LRWTHETQMAGVQIAVAIKVKQCRSIYQKKKW